MGPQITFVLLANHASTHDGLLFLSEAGWSNLVRPPAPAGENPMCHFAIAVGLSIPWNETNKHHRFVLTVEDEDGQEVFKVENDRVEAGRPAGAAIGGDQTLFITFDAVVPFPAVGGYRALARIGDHSVGTSFRVVESAPGPVAG